MTIAQMESPSLRQQFGAQRKALGFFLILDR